MSKIISTNPAKGYEEIGSIEISTDVEIKCKVLSAQKAKQSWKETPLKKRKEYFRRLI